MSLESLHEYTQSNNDEEDQESFSIPLLNLTQLYFDHRCINVKNDTADRTLTTKSRELFINAYSREWNKLRHMTISLNKSYHLKNQIFPRGTNLGAYWKKLYVEKTHKPTSFV